MDAKAVVRALLEGSIGTRISGGQVTAIRAIHRPFAEAFGVWDNQEGPVETYYSILTGKVCKPTDRCHQDVMWDIVCARVGWDRNKRVDKTENKNV